MIEIYLQKRKIKMIDNIDRLIHYKQLKKLPKEIKPNKFINYLEEQKFSFDYYLDYIYRLRQDLCVNGKSIPLF